MKVAVMGAGSMGGYFGGMLARAGHDVTLIARGENLAAIRRDGLRMHTEAGDFTVPCSATDRPADVGPVDLALLTTKTYHNVDAVPSMAPLIGSNTAVLSLQNGIDSYLPVTEQFPDAIMLPGAAYIEASRQGPGVVQQAGRVVRIVALAEPGVARRSTWNGPRQSAPPSGTPRLRRKRRTKSRSPCGRSSCSSPPWPA